MDAIEYIRNRQSALEELSDEEFERYRAFHAAAVLVRAAGNWNRSTLILADKVAIQLLALFPYGLPDAVTVEESVTVTR